MKLSVVAELEDCDGTSRGGGCPTIYVTDRQTYVIQGEAIDLPALEVPANERVIEVPASLLTAIKDRL